MKKFLVLNLLITFLTFFDLFSQVKPKLVIPVGHTYDVNTAMFSPDGKYILSGSVDATLKLWEVKTGKEIRTFSGQHIDVLAVSFSHEGKYVLSGGKEGKVVLWDMQSGKPVSVFVDEVNAGVYKTGFSSDDKTIWAIYPGGISFWDVLSGKLIKHGPFYNEVMGAACISGDLKFLLAGQRDYSFVMINSTKFKETGRFIGHTGSVISLNVSHDQRLAISASRDGTVRLWDIASTKELRKFEGHSWHIYTTCFSPDNSLVVTGSLDSTLKLWNVSTGELIRTFKGHKNIVNAVDFSADGKTVLSTSADKTIKIWDVETGKLLKTLSGSANICNFAYMLNENSSIVLAFNKGYSKLLDLVSNSGISPLQSYGIPNYGYSVSNDGRVSCVETIDSILVIDVKNSTINKKYNKKDYSLSTSFFLSGIKELITTTQTDSLKWFDYENGKFTRAKKIPKGFIENISAEGKFMLVRDFSDSLLIYDVEKEQIIRKYDESFYKRYGLSISPLGNYLKIFSIDTIRFYYLKSNKVEKFIHEEGTFFTFSELSPDEKYILAGMVDGSVRIYDTNTSKEIANVLSLGENDWIITTPSGLFDASAIAMKKLYYVQGLETIDMDQLKDRYFEPGLIQKLLGFNSEKVRDVDGIGELKLYPDIELKLNRETGILNINLRNRGGGIGKVLVYINGKEISDDARPKDINEFSKQIDLAVNILNNPVLVKGKLNEIAVRAYNSEGYLLSRDTKVFYNPGFGFDKSVEDPSLFVLCSGISDYTGDEIDLKFAAKDAEDMSRALLIAAKRLFGASNASVYLLTTEKGNAVESNGFKRILPTKKNIISSFREIAEKAKSIDILVVYLAGHGINLGGQDGDWFYLTQDAYNGDLSAYSDSLMRKSTTVSSAEFVEMIKKVPSLKQVLIIDACASGKMVENLMVQRNISSSAIRALDRMKDRTGMHILTGCTADAVSYESNRFGQGLLTYSLLEGMKGTALREDKFVDISKLFQTSRDRVPVLAEGLGGIQKPEIFSPFGSESFDIGMLTSEDKDSIPLAKSKPLFTMTMMQDEVSFDDVLNLGKQIDEQLRDMTSRGKKAPLIFIETKEFPSAYRLIGRYVQKGNKVQIKVNLFKGKEKLQMIDVKGNKTDVAKLAEEIVNKSKDLVK